MTSTNATENDAQDKAFNQTSGLTREQVDQRVAADLVNHVTKPRSKTIGQIVSGNLLTYFNLINFLIFLLILTTGEYVNTLFMGIVAANTLIGIIQELRAKRALDKLAIITAVKATVIREGQTLHIPLEAVVMDDLVVLMPGNQVCADGEVLTSQELEVDESLLTGESEPVLKMPGDPVLSGSFVVTGSATFRVVHVGQDSFAQKITVDAHRYERARSEIQTTLKKVIRVISLIVVPIGALLFLNQYLRSDISWQDAVVSSAAGMIGMIPEGLIFLTSITLVLGILKLSRRRALVQELAGIEILARVDVLCLDKTGTLTLGIMKVIDIVPLDPPADDPRPGHTNDAPEQTNDMPVQDVCQATAAIVAAFKDKNSTASAIAAYCGEAPEWQVRSLLPFSSARKWSCVCFEEMGTWVLGAPETILKDQFPDVLKQAQKYAADGLRVILVSSTPECFTLCKPAGETPAEAPTRTSTSAAVSNASNRSVESEMEAIARLIVPRALILLSDTVRPGARETLDFFAQNDVAIKIISGDHPEAVAAVARQVQVREADRFVDATTIPSDPQSIDEAARKYTVFGRVTPQQKKRLIDAFKRQGHTVAMTGDGINDVQALREADCSIVVASGSDAAKSTAHIVLLDSDFTAMPDVVSEGRQVINNIERVASLYLVKTTYASLLSLAFIIIGTSYPFNPIHQTLLGGFAIGIPSFFLALEKNYKRIQPNFLRRVVLTAIPGGLTFSIMLLLIEFLQWRMAIPADQTRLIAVMVAAIVNFMILLRVSSPLNLKRTILLIAMAALFITESFVFAGWLGFTRPATQSLIIILILGTLVHPLMLALRGLATWCQAKWQAKQYQALKRT